MTPIHAMYRPRHGLGEAAREVLARGQHAILGTTNPDASVHLAPVLFLHHDGRIYIETSSGTRKVRNVIARPAATILVQSRVPAPQRSSAATRPSASDT
jgi:nitroimidazol reductase NimA-like FMN-containing flavoprotein (pyridoxamine 5'-phosphate oxidase superfamily)